MRRSLNWVDKTGGVRSSLSTSIDVNPRLSKSRQITYDKNESGKANLISDSTKTAMSHAVTPGVFLFTVILGLGIGLIVGTNLRKN